MTLLIAGVGPLAAAIRAALEGSSESIKTASADAEDLFMQALGSSTIVYAPAPSLLEARELPQPDPARMRNVVRAANAPGVKLLLGILPAGDAYAAEEDVVRKEGPPYHLLRLPPLLEELAEATNFHVSRSVWLPRGTRITLGTVATAQAAVREALRKGPTGDCSEVPGEPLDAAEAVQRAAQIAGAALNVHVTSPGVAGALRRVSAWLHADRRDPAAGAFQRLTQTAA